MASKPKNTKAPGEQWTEDTARAFLVQAFDDLFDPNNDAAVSAKKYLTSDYSQSVDGSVLDYDGFVRHLNVLRHDLLKAEFVFEMVVASGNTIADIHIVHAVKRDGSALRTKVIAFYHMSGRKIQKIDELTYMLEGDAEDRNMGSRVSHD